MLVSSGASLLGREENSDSKSYSSKVGFIPIHRFILSKLIPSNPDFLSPYLTSILASDSALIMEKNPTGLTFPLTKKHTENPKSN